MKLRIFSAGHLIALIILSCSGSFANDPVWTWVKGISIQRNYGIYGTLGVESSTNTPQSGLSTTIWTGKDGRIWMLYDGFWRFDPATGNWTCLAKYSKTNYGIQGVAAKDNAPQTRAGAASWTDASGRLWLWGGWGSDVNDNQGNLNDLWQYDPASGYWTWIKGSKYSNQYSVYGTIGVADAANAPGGRMGATAWRGADGVIWFFGGTGYESTGGLYNSLWRYEPATNNWTWVKGSKLPNQAGTFGTRGQAATANVPGARRDGVSWTGSDGKFWLFGGYGYAASGSASGQLNDLWRYDPSTNQWTWMKGNNDLDRKGVYGTRGTPGSGNYPGGREGASGWIDASGRLYLAGGAGFDASDQEGHLNDLWRYDPVADHWVWLEGSQYRDQPGSYGALGVAASSNAPGGRTQSAAWRDSSGRLWLWGGGGYDAVGLLDELNDLWRYDPATGNWTWLKGCNSRDAKGVYGAKGVTASANAPGIRDSGAAWRDQTGKLWLWGGWGADAQGVSGYLDDLWRYDPATNQWTWIEGHDRLSDTALPGAPRSRADHTFWTGTDGKFYLWGGYWWTPTADEYLHDLWCYDPSVNAWRSIFNSNYGDWWPRGRYGAVSWTGKDGKLWMFGGHIYYTKNHEMDQVEGDSNYLTYFDPRTGQWKRVRNNDDDSLEQQGSYGTRGVEAPGNTPGSRVYASTWTDWQGRLWLFGGSGNDASESGGGSLNDLWRYNPSTNNWTWIKGSNMAGQAGVYGARGIAAPVNTPGARVGAVAWTDSYGKFWLFGGRDRRIAISDETGYFNDLWRFDPVTENWTWIAGGSSLDMKGKYGRQGVSAISNMPGARFFGHAWCDPYGNAWLLGGWGHDAASGPTGLADLWRMAPPQNAVDRVGWHNFE